MPATAKTTDDAIAEAASRLVERSDEDFSMAAVATAVGVRAPSLYKRYADREALLARVKRDAYAALRASLAAANGNDAVERVRALAVAYRAFALEHPRLYALLFSPEQRPDEATHTARAAAAAPALEALRDVVGEAHALDAARTFTAFLHGHVTMVLAGAFRLGGDVDAAFAYGLDCILRGIASAERITGGTRPTRSRSA